MGHPLRVRIFLFDVRTKEPPGVTSGIFTSLFQAQQLWVFCPGIQGLKRNFQKSNCSSAIPWCPPRWALGFRLTLLKQANFKLITCWRILPCWILAGCFCKLWKINVKYADVFCLKQMFGPSCQNPINCSPWGLPPTTLSQSSLGMWRGDQSSTSKAFEEASGLGGLC